jgi:hypothetical protein
MQRTFENVCHLVVCAGQVEVANVVPEVGVRWKALHALLVLVQGCFAFVGHFQQDSAPPSRHGHCGITCGAADRSAARGASQPSEGGDAAGRYRDGA